MEKKPPAHLAKATADWWRSVVDEFDGLEEHHIKLLTLAGESWDRCVQAREAIAKHGLTFDDRFGAPHSRPEIAIERDSRISFARLVRELALDVAEPAQNEVRPPKIVGKAGKKGL